jgi:bifunctional DNA-binding transcriptional regulator/antitoxin component of YhaV-PrlF toxin-antitoxin module
MRDTERATTVAAGERAELSSDAGAVVVRKVRSKNELTLPKKLAEAAGIGQGAMVVIDAPRAGEIRIRKARMVPTPEFAELIERAREEVRSAEARGTSDPDELGERIDEIFQAVRTVAR